MFRMAIKKSLVAVVALTLATVLAVPVVEAGNTFPKTLRIPAGHKHSSKLVNVGLNRSLVVELAEDATDVLVASPSIADAVIKSSRRVYILGIAAGQSSVTIFGRGGRQIASFAISVEPDTSDIQHMLRSLLPNSAISVAAVNGSLVLSGTAATPVDAKRAADIASRFTGDAEKVINLVGSGGSEQVHLKVAIAEVQRTVIKQLGFDLEAALTRGTFAATAVTANPFGVAGRPITDTLLSAGSNFGDFRLDATFRALQQDGFIKLLAEPTLTAVSGESASFLVGGEFPIPVGNSENGITIEFKQFGIGLDFTPVVLSGGRISLKVKTEVSEITSDNAFSIQSTDTTASLVIPGLFVRRADTMVELPSGGSMVLAGLIKDDIRKVVNGVPGLLQLPILGALFKSRDFQKSQSELVVFVTPYLVDPVATSKLQRPDQNLTFSSDAAAFFLNRVNRVYRFPGSEEDVAGYRGSFGFFFE